MHTGVKTLVCVHSPPNAKMKLNECLVLSYTGSLSLSRGLVVVPERCPSLSLGEERSSSRKDAGCRASQMWTSRAERQNEHWGLVEFHINLFGKSCSLTRRNADTHRLQYRQILLGDGWKNT